MKPVKTMAEVIREALSWGSYQIPDDTKPYESQANVIADHLTAAGFGPVKAAQVDAWAKGATSAGLNLMALQAAGINPNPYRIEPTQ
jgi:hypothetical protein